MHRVESEAAESTRDQDFTNPQSERDKPEGFNDVDCPECGATHEVETPLPTFDYF